MSRQTHFCQTRKKEEEDVFVATKMILVAAPATDSDQASLVTVYRVLPEDEESTVAPTRRPPAAWQFPDPPGPLGKKALKGEFSNDWLNEQLMEKRKKGGI